MSISEEVALILLKRKAVTLNPKEPYRFTSGILSPIYTDCRLLISHPKERARIISYLIKEIKKTGRPNVIAGTATAGIPWASWIAKEMKLPMIYVRGKAKEHGKKKQFEGEFKKGQKVVVIEDLISTSKSSIETVGVVRKNGGEVNTIVAIFSYEMPEAKINQKKAKVKLSALVTIPQLAEIAVKNKYLDKKDKETVLAWAKDPQNWRL